MVSVHAASVGTSTLFSGLMRSAAPVHCSSGGEAATALRTILLQPAPPRPWKMPRSARRAFFRKPYYVVFRRCLGAFDIDHGGASAPCLAVAWEASAPPSTNQ